MAAGTQYNKHLNYDQAYVKTPAVYDSNVNEWMMLVRNYVYTGTLWVPRKGDANSGFVGGPAAHDAAAAGNPVQIGGVYWATDPNVADGDVASLRVNAKGEVLTQLTGSYEVIDCVIAQNGTASSEADIRKYKYFSFLMPAGWDSATLTIKGSATTGGTKQTIKNDVGQTFPPMTVAVDTVYSIDAYAEMLASVQFISFVASAAQTTAARTIKLMCKA